MALTIGDLLEGRDKPLSVSSSAMLSSAIEQMLKHDYTQLPVTTESGKLVGMITSDSVLRALEAFGLSPAQMTVADAMTKARSFDPDADVNDLLNALRDQYAALVVDGEDNLIGIITGYDASEYFRKRSEDNMLLEDIESSIKEHVLAAFEDTTGKLDSDKLSKAISKVADPNRALRAPTSKAVQLYLSRIGTTGPPDQSVVEQVVAEACPEGKPPTFDKLTLAAYIDLLLHTSVWPTYSHVFGIEAEALKTLLDKVRDTRNALAHFRGEISATDRERLRFCASWLERRPPRHVAAPPPVSAVTVSASAEPATDVVPVDEEIEPGEGRYARLAVWLQKAEPSQDAVSLTFNQVEEILGGGLPDSAREHRSWWANDSVSHPQSRRWLEVGWRVANLSLSNEVVTFMRIEEREAAYISFFSQLISRLERIGAFPLRTASPSGANWHTFARLSTSGFPLGLLVCSFARGARVRVEFYIDCKDADANKAVFDKLLAGRGEIEAKFGYPLSWERLDNRQASRIAAYQEGAITDDLPKLDALVEWSADALVQLRESLIGPMSRLDQ